MALAPEDDEPSHSWEELLRKFLPVGAPLPDEDQLDYSISFDYVGPSPYYKKPPISNPAIPRERFAAFPKQPPSLTPRNTAWLKSRSGDVITNSDIEQFSVSSIDFDYASDGDGDSEPAGGDQGNIEPPEIEVKTKRRNPNSSSVKPNKKCNRCGKMSNGLLSRGRREVCIVCGAEYCKKCVLKAMGTMPEGRKCISCIGNPIDEANRGKLGKGFSLLSRLFGRPEIEQIKKVEKECAANQVRPEQVAINGRELREDELDALLGCTLPPKDLNPGKYWYDKDSGLWGKEGQKPDRIISANLGVGGKLQTGASNGRTRVYVNGREITNVELRVLKLAKVQCTRNTHFWLYEDGSYEEEGQNKIKGNIWEKASVRLVSSLFGLPVPPQNSHRTKEEPVLFSAPLCSEYLEQHRVYKLLLLGLDCSEASTIFKQAKFMYSNKYTAKELQNFKLIIQRNTYRYLGFLLEGREHFEEELLARKEPADRSVRGEMKSDRSRECIYSVDKKINDFSEWLLDMISTGDIDTFSTARASEIHEILEDPAVQETCKRLEELQLPLDIPKYFLDSAFEILSDDYVPSEKDILLAEGITPSNGLSCIEFSFEDYSIISEIHHQRFDDRKSPSKYQLIYLGSKALNNGCKWLEMFDMMNIVIFCISLIDYDQIWTHGKTGLRQNKMLANREFFERMARHSSFEDKPFLLVLTKYDLFEEKMSKVPITVCEWFRDFNPMKMNSKNLSLAHQAFYYIAVKFKEIYTSITGRKLYVHQAQALDRVSVDEVFIYTREIVEWEEVKDEEIYAVREEEDLLLSGPETMYYSL